MGRPKKGDFTSPKTVRLDKDIYELIEGEAEYYGNDFSTRLREILRQHYRNQEDKV